MRIVGVVGASHARGLRLAGFEAFDDSDPRSAAERVRALSRERGVGLVLLSPRIAAIEPAAVAALRGAEPPLAGVIPDPETP